MTHGENVQCWYAISSLRVLCLFWNFTIENKEKKTRNEIEKMLNVEQSRYAKEKEVSYM